MTNTVKIYRANSGLANPKELVVSMFSDLIVSSSLARRLLARDLNAKYRQTFLGYFWALIPPIFVAYGLVLATQARVINVGYTEIPYPAYVILSMVLWQTFLDSFNGPLSAVIESRAMLAKINFPREAIILAKIGEIFFNLLIKLILVIFVFLYYKIPVTKMIFLSPFGLLSLIVLGTFLGLLIAPIGAIYQDVSKSILVLTTPWLMITPVLYPVPTSGFFSKIVNLNPVTSILVTTRELFTTGMVTNFYGFLFVSLGALVGLFFTWIFFRLAIPYVIERMP